MQAYTPEFILIGLAIALLLADSFLKKIPKYAFGIIGGAGTMLIAAYYLRDYSWMNNRIGLYPILAHIATALAIFMSVDFKTILERTANETKSEEGTGEFYILPMIACAGITAMFKATNMLMLFVSLEVLTLSSYILVGYLRRNIGSLEAGVKYLILGATSTGIMVFGMAWYFGMTATFEIGYDVVQKTIISGNAMGLYFSLALLILGAAFKIGAFPMQMWIPDVYQGAPLPITAFLSVASKIAGFIFLSIIIAPFGNDQTSTVNLVIALMAAATLLVGNLGAIGQTNMKRLLGYSSIAQAGFIIPFFLTHQITLPGLRLFGGPQAVTYLAIYLVMTMGAFFALGLIRAQRESEEISAFRGLGKTNPRLAFAITVMFASLAGVPMTGGFFAKLISFLHVIDFNSYNMWLLPIMIICAGTGFYYYFKVIKAMYWDKPQPEDSAIRVPLISGLALGISTAILLVMGILPLIAPSVR